MKKLFFRVIFVLLILAVLAVVMLGLFLDTAIKRGVETVGPMLTKVDVKLESVSLSLFSGSGKIKGLIVGNPEGYKTPSAINVGAASLALRPGSLLSDKIVIKSVEVQGPEITFETDLKGNNLSKILANLEAATGGGGKEPSQPKEAKPPKKLEVDEFNISGGKIHVSVTALGGKSATIPLPPIHLKDLGKDSDGITGAELAKVVLTTVIENATKEATSAVNDLGKGAVYFGKTLEGAGTNSLNKAAKSIGDLFKKK